LGTLRLLVEPIETVPAAARGLIKRVQQSTTADLERTRLVELIETIVVYTFPRLSRQEISTMLGFTDMRETRVYQEGREEEAKSLILKQLTRKLGAEPPEALQQQISQLPLDVLEALGEALFDFNEMSDLRDWLEQV
jgi:predicted transposase YdaD